jgi:hypothetical protein
MLLVNTGGASGNTDGCNTGCCWVDVRACITLCHVLLMHPDVQGRGHDGNTRC